MFFAVSSSPFGFYKYIINVAAISARNADVIVFYF